MASNKSVRAKVIRLPLLPDDHTLILEFIFTQRTKILKNARNITPLTALQKAKALAKDDLEKVQLLTNAMADYRVVARSIREISHDDWIKVVPVLVRIAGARNTGEVKSLVKVEAARLNEMSVRADPIQEGIRIGLDVADQILDSGADTIYDSVWVAQQAMDPRAYLGQAQNMMNAVDNLLDKAAGLAKADAVGAVASAAGATATGEKDPRAIGGKAVAGAVAASVAHAMR